MPEVRPSDPQPSDPRDTQIVHIQLSLARALTVRTAIVALYGVTRGAPEELGTVEVPPSGGFDVVLPVRGERQLFYAVATIEWLTREGTPISIDGATLQLVTVFSADERRVVLSEPATVATAYAFARFATVEPGTVADDSSVVISDPQRAAHLALGLRQTLVETDGSISSVIQSPPNGLETNSWPMLNFLSGLVSYALEDPTVYDRFTEITSTRSLFGALLALPRDPWLGSCDDGSNEIYSLVADKPQPFSPSLPALDLPHDRSPVPNNWTLTVKRNRSGAQNFLIAGVGLVDFDRNDRAWLAINVRQGTPSSATFTVVLEPDGSPAPFSPVFGGGVLGAGFGIAASPRRDKIAIGNFGWGGTEWNPQRGSVSLVSCDGEILTPSEGWTRGLSRVQGVVWDRDGNLWMSSWGTQDPMPPAQSRLHFEGEESAVVVYLDGDPERMLKHRFDNPHHLTFDVAVDDEGNCYVSNSGSKAEGVPSSVHKVRISDDRQSLEHLAGWTSHHGDDGVETFRQIAVGPDGHVYVVAVASNRIVRLDPDLSHHTALHGTNGPWGIVFDRDGLLFASNFGRDIDFTTGDPELSIGPFSITVIRDGDDSTARLLTLPTGGAEVTLANGLPLYGNPTTPSGSNHPDQPIPVKSYDPLMRLTASAIDRAGNLWACNNWKPSVLNNVVYGNPGGDGVVIFLGVAAPARFGDEGGASDGR